MRSWTKQLFDIQKQNWIRISIQFIFLFVVVSSCNSDPYGSHWIENEAISISQYLNKNQQEYSKYYKLISEGKMLSPLYGYNPYGNDFTLFLPTNKAIDRFIEQSKDYESFEELLGDTNFIYSLTRFHTLKRKVHTDEFPDGILADSTFTGDRLAFGFYADGENQVIKVNNKAPIIESNLEMTNGYIHVISEVLQQVKVSGYDWIQQQEDYSILAELMEITRIKYNLWWNKYTILAEHDSIYHKNGIYNIDDLKNHFSSLKISNFLYKFAGYHIVGGEYFLNNLNWGNYKYTTMGGESLIINVGFDIQINPGIDNYGFTVSESGDTTVFNYIRPIWENCNNISSTGPIHSISNLLFYEPLPE